MCSVKNVVGRYEGNPEEKHSCNFFNLIVVEDEFHFIACSTVTLDFMFENRFVLLCGVDMSGLYFKEGDFCTSKI